MSGQTGLAKRFGRGLRPFDPCNVGAESRKIATPAVRCLEHSISLSPILFFGYLADNYKLNVQDTGGAPREILTLVTCYPF